MDGKTKNSIQNTAQYKGNQSTAGHIPDIEKKIRKLLALSESPNEFEAQAALLKARQLMAEYKLTEAKLHEGNKKVKTIKTSISCTKQTNFWIFTLSTVIGENYCCQAVHERAKHSKT